MPTSPFVIVLGVLTATYSLYSWHTQQQTLLTASAPVFFLAIVAFTETNSISIYLLPIAFGTSLAAKHVHRLATFPLPIPPLAYCETCKTGIAEADELYFVPIKETTETYCSDCRIQKGIDDLKD